MHWDPCLPRSSKDRPSSHCQHKWEWISGSAFPQTYQWNRSRSHEKQLCRHQHLPIIFLNTSIILSSLQRDDDYQSAASKPWVKEPTSSRGRSRSTSPLCEDRGVKPAESSALLSPLSRNNHPPRSMWTNGVVKISDSQHRGMQTLQAGTRTKCQALK